MPPNGQWKAGFDFEMVNVDLQPDLADNLRDQGFASYRS
jgi:hypothetical protein